ncbi:MAG: YraN family protein [Acidobacteriota bacterium]
MGLVTTLRRHLAPPRAEDDDRDELAIRGERKARGYLERRGYLTLEVRFRAKVGEVDLVMQDGEAIVFVEVKTRRSLSAGEPEEAVTPKKIDRIAAGATVYLKARRLAHREARIDVVSVTFDGRRARVRHHRNAAPLR